MDAHAQMIMDEYLEQRESFEILNDKVLDLLRETIDKNGIFVTGVEGRVKSAKSLEGKLELKGSKYASIYEITDIVGCRVITFYSDEVDRISALVESLFNVDRENSVDKRKMLQQDQFGYMSLHYVCQLPKSLYYDADRPELNEIKFEIQMRSALQHVWATIYHDIGYKNDIEVPKEYLRSLSCLSGLLEIADGEFLDIRDSIGEYREKIKALIKDGRFEDIEINGDSFKDYLDLGPFDNLNKKIASINHADLLPASVYYYLEIIKDFGFKNLGDIEKFRKENEEDAFRLAKYQLGGKDIDILSSSVGIQNLCVVFILKNGFGVAGLKRLYDKLNGDKPRNITSAERFYRQAQEAGII